MKKRYEEHLETVVAAVAGALELAAEHGESFDGVVFHSGRQRTYHAQDRTIDFQPVPHFARFAPVPGPDHLLLVRPGLPVRLVRFVPSDFWYERAKTPAHPWTEALEVTQVGSRGEARVQVGPLSRWAYVGDDPALAEQLGVAAEGVEPRVLMAALDWARSEKTPYEVACIREAARLAGPGHAAARQGAIEGRSEWEIHAAYLEATGLLEFETPYANIIAYDEAGAVLHYSRKRRTAPDPGHTFLIDAGASHLGYASDVTRTYALEGAHQVFAGLVTSLEALQRSLVAAVAPDVSYVALHERALQGVCEILAATGVVTVPATEAFERGVGSVFLPHGLGHQLGLQVHDVAGHQAGPAGGETAPPPELAALRNTRTLTPGQVVTIEPGLYFFPCCSTRCAGRPSGSVSTGSSSRRCCPRAASGSRTTSPSPLPAPRT